MCFNFILNHARFSLCVIKAALVNIFILMCFSFDQHPVSSLSKQLFLVNKLC